MVVYNFMIVDSDNKLNEYTYIIMHIQLVSSRCSQLNSLFLISLKSFTFGTAEWTAEDFKSDDFKCSIAKFEFDKFLASGTGLKNDGEKFIGYPVIGYQNNMQAAGQCLSRSEDKLLTACSWDLLIK